MKVIAQMKECNGIYGARVIDVLKSTGALTLTRDVHGYSIRHERTGLRIAPRGIGKLNLKQATAILSELNTLPFPWTDRDGNFLTQKVSQDIVIKYGLQDNAYKNIAHVIGAVFEKHS